MKLRAAQKSDYPKLFAIHDDAQSHFDAGFSELKTQVEYFKHLDHILNMESVILKVIDVDGDVVGIVGKWVMDENPELMYWMSRDYMGQGLATKAVELFLRDFSQRPMYAHTAADHKASHRVLEKNRFKLMAEMVSFADARNIENLEYVWKLD